MLDILKYFSSSPILRNIEESSIDLSKLDLLAFALPKNFRFICSENYQLKILLRNRWDIETHTASENSWSFKDLILVIQLNATQYLLENSLILAWRCFDDSLNKTNFLKDSGFLSVMINFLRVFRFHSTLIDIPISQPYENYQIFPLPMTATTLYSNHWS